MSLIGLTAAMVASHADHATRHPRCPVCSRFGPAPNDPEQVSPGRVIAVNAPCTANPEDWE